jgi:hypothetical protein
VVRAYRAYYACAALTVALAACSGSGTPAGPFAPPGPGGRFAHRARPDMPTCSGLGSKAFVGGANGNVAAGADSGVLSGISNEACDARSGIGAGLQNAVAGTGGAATDSFIAGGYSNAITGSGQLSFIGAGNTNAIEQANSAIGAGVQNTNDGAYSTIGAGDGNRIGSADVTSGYDLIGGGLSNTILANYSTIAGGKSNEIFADYAFLGGGGLNVIGKLLSSAGEYGAIGGGELNSVQGQYAFVGGGYNNQANGQDSVVPGGLGNVAAGTGSFAAGNDSWAAFDGSFVWSDSASGATQLKAGANDQFLARASGGFIFYTDNITKSGATLASGSGTWASLSDRNSKTALASVNASTVLERLEKLPISIWSYRSEGRVRHIGPMAQDFYRAFGLGSDDKHITTIDEEGVAYAAIGALDARLERARALAADAAALRTRLRAQERTIDDLRAQIAKLEKK